jgi:hypothetical protein
MGREPAGAKISGISMIEHAAPWACCLCRQIRQLIQCRLAEPWSAAASKDRAPGRHGGASEARMCCVRVNQIDSSPSIGAANRSAVTTPR